MDKSSISLILFAAFFIGILILYIRGEPRKDNPDRPTTLIPRDALSRLGVTSLVLTATDDSCFSKIGGTPELASDLVWPVGKDGPRVFLAQLDLAEVTRWGGPEWLPTLGRIYAFTDEERGGFADHVVILASTQAPGAPSGIKPAKAFPERRVEGHPYTSFPSPEWLGVDGVEGEQEGLDEFVIEPEPVRREGMHRIGGFPSEIQGGVMLAECEALARGFGANYDDLTPDEMTEAAASWRMLLQIDSDPELKMNWWDGGRFYVFIREDDARVGDFSRTVTISQSH
jgi:hypothetical protein